MISSDCAVLPADPEVSGSTVSPEYSLVLADSLKAQASGRYEACLESASLRMLAEAEPTLLVRISSLLAQLDLVPDQLVVGPAGQGILKVSIGLWQVEPRRLDLLQRKLCQLPQCLGKVERY